MTLRSYVKLIQQDPLHVITSYFVCAFHLASEYSPITGVYAQVLPDELAQPEGGLLVVHFGGLVRSREEPAVAVGPPRG